MDAKKLNQIGELMAVIVREDIEPLFILSATKENNVVVILGKNLTDERRSRLHETIKVLAEMPEELIFQQVDYIKVIMMKGKGETPKQEEGKKEE